MLKLNKIKQITFKHLHLIIIVNAFETVIHKYSIIIYLIMCKECVDRCFSKNV